MATDNNFQGNKFWGIFGIFSSTAMCSIISSGITYPIEVMKVNYQNSKNSKIGPIISHIYKKGGIQRFYRGIGTNITCLPLFWSVFFASKEIANKYSEYDGLNIFLCSAVASTLSNPLFVLRVRLQTEYLLTDKKISYVPIIKDMYKSEGLIGFTKGTTPTILNNSKLILQFKLYDYFRNKMSQYKKYSDNIFVSATLPAFFAKILANNLLYPTDLVRTQQRSNKKKYNNVFKLIHNNYKSGGIRSLYKGSLLYNSVTIPNFLIMMTIKEKISK